MALASINNYYVNHHFCIVLKQEGAEEGEARELIVSASKAKSLEGRKLLIERPHHEDRPSLHTTFKDARDQGNEFLEPAKGKLAIYNFRSLPSRVMGRPFADRITEESYVARMLAITFDDAEALPLELNATDDRGMSPDRLLLTGVRYPTIEDVRYKDLPKNVVRACRIALPKYEN